MTPDMVTLIPAVFVAGVLMFLAPCTLPIVPGYLAFIAGVPEKEISKTGFSEAKRRVMRNALAFCVGFSLVFIVLGLFAASIGGVLGAWRGLISQGAGVIIIVFGLTMLGLIKIPVLMSERRIRTPHFIVVGRPESSFLIGMLFALGWTPCVGPILGTVLLFASSSSTAAQGALLLFVFSLGLTLPFMVTAFLIGSAGKWFAKMRGSVELLSKIAGGILVVFGFYMLFGYMGFFMQFGFDGLLKYL
ncbi:cytochrome c biogenesis protein CcdA [Patescibacteria group bacterium]|nr:cytochrome c biogenesis protein CcdA [Patescibacteria group bacterium]